MASTARDARRTALRERDDAIGTVAALRSELATRAAAHAADLALQQAWYLAEVERLQRQHIQDMEDLRASARVPRATWDQAGWTLGPVAARLPTAASASSSGQSEAKPWDMVAQLQADNDRLVERVRAWEESFANRVASVYRALN